MKKRRIKDFDELTITDDFMFGAVISDSKRCKPLLEYILGIRINRVEYIEKQKTIDLEYASKGVRLDLHVIDDKENVYNIEIQTTSRKNLPKRIRYYHDVLDLNLLQKNADYEALNQCYVIFICTFDFFSKGRYMYTFKRQCQEDATVFLSDEATSIVLNINGTVGEINEELRNALHYMAGQIPAGKFAKDLDNAVKEVKQNKDWRTEYMTYAMKIREHEIEAKKIGILESQISAVRHGRGKISDDLMMSILGLKEDEFIKISDMITQNPDWTDEDIAWELSEG